MPTDVTPNPLPPILPPDEAESADPGVIDEQNAQPDEREPDDDEREVGSDPPGPGPLMPQA